MNEHLTYTDDRQYWLDVYQGKIKFLARERESAQIPWEIRRPDPNLINVLDQRNLTGGRLLELGCGRGYDSRYLSARGFQVTAIDISPEVIAEAATIDPASRVEFVCADFFQGSPQGLFDIVYDRGFLHGYPAQLREIFLKLEQILAPQGLVIAITGNPNQSEISSCVPPPIHLGELEQAAWSGFKILRAEEIEFYKDPAYDPSLGYLFVLERRS